MGVGSYSYKTMRDVRCKKCGEPYSIYSLRHEVSDWEDQPDDAHDKFMNGEGCPTCEWGDKAGDISTSRSKSQDELESEHLMDKLRESDEDPMKFI